jgi:oligopeptide transport system substrate-binding protein
MTATSRAHWWATLALSGVGALLLLGFLGPREALPVQSRPAGDEGVLRVAYSQALQIDPHRRSFPIPVQNLILLGLWEPLIECDPETGQPQPAAAESWEWSSDRRTLTLKLRPDGRWSNGDRVTAHDFVRGWRRLLQQNMELAAILYPLKNAEAFNMGQIKDPAEVGVEAVDDLTLRLKLAGVRSTLVTELADPLLAPLHASTEAVLQDYRYCSEPEKLVTNGAFALQRATAEGFRLRPSAFFRDRAHVKLGGAEFVKVDGWRMGRLLLAAGKVDLLAPAFGDEKTLPTSRRVVSTSEMELTVTALDLNVTRGPLQDVRVRRALSLALDREAPLRLSDEERMVPAFAWVPDMPGRPGLKLLREDADEARRLLAEAGYPGGRGFPVLYLPISVRWRGYSFFQTWTDRWYHELGIRTYVGYERDELRPQRKKSGDYDIFFNGLQATVPDAGDMLSTFAIPGMFSGSHWEDEEVKRLLLEADRVTGAERLALLEQAERRVMDAVPTIPTMFERRRTFLAEEVQGWYADPLGRQSLRRLSIRQPVREVERIAL